ncbi:ABC transporter ATP-binding protein [Microbacterium marinilacus]|uniref:ABC transporter ATP-binding protein n=1 Tax=Microbacterium marinilacus TaxID=415209 RepID=A0ABP7BAB8_9MICO|nr:ABC transporter ATP-binding protein [Microbacterium marinilacus]MBY0687241.1 ABC transporter ATP-binding protein [Microbacterium marinilacus]
MTAPLLSVRDLRVSFSTPGGPFEAVKGVSFDVAAGETVAIVGESGSGKSTVAASINRLLAGNGRISAGSIDFDGRELTTLSEREMTALRGAGIGLVPQDPMSNLNPVHTVGAQILEALQVHGRPGGRARVLELLDMVGIPEPERRVDQYPHEFSGGMRQRALIAMGLACEPRLLIADEPTSALDVTVQRRILDRLGELTGNSGTSVILITHDLALAAERADRVLVMFRGELVEAGPAGAILETPREDYTRRLVAAAPSLATTPLIDAGGVPDDQPETLVSVEAVGRSYRLRGRARGEEFWAARDVTFAIPRGRTVSIVGESGSGKSTTAKMLLGLETASEGTIRVGGKDLARMGRRELFAVRRTVQPVFQNPFASLDPRYTIADSIAEPLRVHRIGDRRSRGMRVRELLDQVALPADLAERLPHELSGGQRQRVAIARALAVEPELVVLDEAVSALDVLVQAQILELLVDLQRRLGLGYLFISHDLAVVNMISHEVHVMQRGRIVESGTPESIFRSPQQDYTRELLAAIPGGIAAGA